jgi:hypothetical protein
MKSVLLLCLDACVYAALYTKKVRNKNKCVFMVWAEARYFSQVQALLERLTACMLIFTYTRHRDT